MTERNPWTSSTVGAVAALSGLIGVGIGYGLIPPGSSPPAASGTTEAATRVVSEAPENDRGAKRRSQVERGERKGGERRRKRTDETSGPTPAIDLGSVSGEDWVEVHDPQQAWPGFTLVMYQRRVPMLIDMSGRIVHWWPTVRAVGRARLTTAGHLVYIDADDFVREVDWDGAPIRSYKPDTLDRFPHHDLQWYPDGRIAALYRTRSEFTDDVVILDKTGQPEWTWVSKDHISADIPADPDARRDLTHFNSVQLIPDNPHHQAGDQRFKPGNVLISARNLNTLYLVDRATGEVSWKYSDGLDWQHEAVLLGTESKNAGKILLFNNRPHSEDLRSEVLLIDPTSDRVVWRYSTEGFFSDTGGVAQELPNGNLLITSSRGGRVFELNGDGEVVWQWVPPFLPMRAGRYAPDHCPQLAAMDASTGKSVTSRRSGGYVDAALYDFKRSEGYSRVALGDRKKELATDGSICLDAHLPGKPILTVSMGFFGGSTDASSPMTGEVKVTVTPEDGGEQVLLERTASLAVDGDWFRERVRFPKELGYRKAQVCVHSSAAPVAEGEEPPPGLILGVPKMTSAYRKPAKGLPSVKDGGTTKAEKDLQQRQLEALGYME